MRHGSTNIYPEDPRKKIVEAEHWGMPASHIARTFGAGLSPVECYAEMACEGDPLHPKRGQGRPPKADGRARRLPEADQEGHPAITLARREE